MFFSLIETGLTVSLFNELIYTFSHPESPKLLQNWILVFVRVLRCKWITVDETADKFQSECKISDRKCARNSKW